MNKVSHDAVAAKQPHIGYNAGENSSPKRPRWAQTEGTPLPLGATWIEEERAFNFAVYAEHAESVTLLLYPADDLANPILTSNSISFGTSQDESGTAGSRSIKCAMLVITPTRSPDRPFLSFRALIPKRCCWIPMLNLFSSRPGLTANRAIEPGPNAGKHR